MNVNEFQTQADDGRNFSSRGGSALIDLTLDSTDRNDEHRCGVLSIYEAGEKLNEWNDVKVTRSGIVFSVSDNFYIALELFNTIRLNNETV